MGQEKEKKQLNMGKVQLQLKLIGVPIVAVAVVISTLSPDASPGAGQGEGQGEGEWERLKFPTERAKALLIYLAVEGDAHSREKLATALWPEAEGDKARISLRQELAGLRRVLAPYQPHIQIVNEGDSIRLKAEIVTDLQVIQRAYLAQLHRDRDRGMVDRRRDGSNRLTLANPNNTNAAAASSITDREYLSLLEAVYSVVKGKQHTDILEGFSHLANWAQGLRETTRQKIKVLLRQLAELQTARGEGLKALETVSLWLDYDSYNEQAYHYLMHLYLLRGERDAALRTFYRCRNALKEVDLELSEQTLALAEQLVNPGGTLLLLSNAAAATVTGEREQVAVGGGGSGSVTTDEHEGLNQAVQKLTTEPGYGEQQAAKERARHRTQHKQEQYKLKLLRRLVKLLGLSQLAGSGVLLCLSFLSGQSLLFGATVLTWVALFFYFIGYRLSLRPDPNYQMVSWLILGSTFGTLALDYYVVGADAPLFATFLVVIILAIILMKSWEAFMLTGLIVGWCATMYLSHHIFKIYTPPVQLPEVANDIMNLSTLFVVMPVIALLITTAIRTQFEQMQTKDEYLEEVVSEYKQASSELSRSLNEAKRRRRLGLLTRPNPNPNPTPSGPPLSETEQDRQG